MESPVVETRESRDRDFSTAASADFPVNERFASDEDVDDCRVTSLGRTIMKIGSISHESLREA